MDLGFTGRRVVVVGASEGIGLATARMMAAEGADLLLAARNEEKLKAAAAALAKDSSTPSVLPVDVTQEGCGGELAGQILNRWDGLDSLVSAVGGSVRSAFEDLSDEDWMENYVFNVLSTVRVVRALLPALRKGRSPSVVLLAAASAKMPTAHQIVSNVHKAGLLGLAKTLAGELAPEGIRVNTVCPGRTLTRLWHDRADKMAAERGTTRDAIIAEFSKDIPFGRFAEPEEVAAVVTFLASPLSGYVTGQHVNADGGLARGLL